MRNFYMALCLAWAVGCGGGSGGESGVSGAFYLETIGLSDGKKILTGIVIDNGQIELREYYFHGENRTAATYRKRVGTYSVTDSIYLVKNTYNTCGALKDETIKITEVDTDRVLIDLPGSGEFTFWRADNLDKHLSDQGMVASIEDDTCSGIGVQGEFAILGEDEDSDDRYLGTLILNAGKIEFYEYYFKEGDLSNGIFRKKVGQYKVNADSFGAEEGETFEIIYEYDTCDDAPTDEVKIKEVSSNYIIVTEGLVNYAFGRLEGTVEDWLASLAISAVEDASLCY